jgi:hypothetical protein
MSNLNADYLVDTKMYQKLLCFDGDASGYGP